MSKLSIEKIFVILSLIFGIIMIIVVPPFNSPDEKSHFVRAYEISKGNPFPSKHDSVEGFLISNNYINYMNEMENQGGKLDIKYNYSEMYKDNICSLQPDDERVYQVSSQYLNIFPYIIPAIGIQITDYLPTFSGEKNSLAVMVQFARFSLLIFTTIIGYFALKITPKFKKSMFFVMIMPMSLFLRSMVTYDGILITVVALALSVMINLIDNKNKRFSSLDFVLLVFSGFVLLNVKVLYSIIFVLMFAIPVSKFKNKKDMIKKYIMMIVSVLFITLIFHIPSFFMSPSTSEIIGQQKDWIISNPLETFSILTNSIISNINIQLYWMVGTYGLLDVYMPVLITFLMLVYLLFIFVNDGLNEKIKINYVITLLLIIFFIIDIYMIYLYMYMNWTPLMLNTIGGSVIEGVQGRYFIPLLFIIPIVLSVFSRFKNKVMVFLKNKISVIIDNSIYLFTITILFISILMMVLRYYI